MLFNCHNDFDLKEYKNAFNRDEFGVIDNFHANISMKFKEVVQLIRKR